MKVEIWSDYVCPFCYIGKRKLELALEQTGMTDKTEIVFKSFELDPDAPRTFEGNLDQLMAKKYGMTLEEAAAANNRIIQAAREVGLNYNYKDLKRTNTFDAHRLSFYAAAEGKIREYTEEVMKSYFILSQDISDFDTLASIARSIGLDRDKALSLLKSSQFSDQIREVESKALQEGINGVPYFIFNEKEAVYGAQAVENFIAVIERIKN